MKSFKIMMFGVFLAVIFLASAGCTPKPVVHQKTSWLFLVYIDGDNDLESYAIQDFNEMEQVGSTDDVTILALFDRRPGYDASNSNWTGTRLYKVTRDDDINIIHSQLQTASPWGKKDNSSEADMSNPQTLRNFIIYCQTFYPADHTVLTLWDHGAGVFPKSLNRSQVRKDEKLTVFGTKSDKLLTNKGICWDDTTGTTAWDCLTTDEIAAALAEARTKTSHKVDLINMDACLMQMIEVAYEWKYETDYITGSEETVPAEGNNYNTLLATLTQNPGMTVEEFANALVDDYYAYYNGSGLDTTYSALKLGASLDTFMTAFAALAVKLKDTADRSGVYKAWNTTSYFEDYSEFSDLYDFTLKLAEQSSDLQVVNAATNLKNAFNGFVINDQETGAHISSGISPAYGLAFFMPSCMQWGYYSESNQYLSLNLCKDTVWGEFITGFVNYTAVRGDWSLSFTGPPNGSFTITFDGEGSFSATDSDTGTWTLAGDQITWVKGGTTYTGTVNFSGGTMAGSMSGAISGDWTAVHQ